MLIKEVQARLTMTYESVGQRDEIMEHLDNPFIERVIKEVYWKPSGNNGTYLGPVNDETRLTIDPITS